jgi:hypothetical protein
MVAMASNLQPSFIGSLLDRLRRCRATAAAVGDAPLAIAVNRIGAMHLNHVFGLDLPDFDPMDFDDRNAHLGMIHGADVYYDRSLDVANEPLAIVRVMSAEMSH